MLSQFIQRIDLFENKNLTSVDGLYTLSKSTKSFTF